MNYATQTTTFSPAAIFWLVFGVLLLLGLIFKPWEK